MNEKERRSMTEQEAPMTEYGNSSIKLIKGQRGACGWELKVEGTDPEEMRERLKVLKQIAKDSALEEGLDA
jgi:hypothetical protein